MRLAGIFLLTVVSMSLPFTVESAVIHVPGDRPTIQAGIDTAMDGDTVLIADGVYTGTGNRDIKIRGKSITVRSQNGAASCIIDCQGSPSELHRGFSFTSGESYDAVLQGVTVKNAFVYSMSGGGIEVGNASSATIQDCTIQNCTANWGGGICTSGHDSLRIIRCRFIENYGFHGGAIHCRENSSLTLSECEFTENAAYSFGGALFVSFYSSASINRCMFRSNDATRGGGIYFQDRDALIQSCVFTGNSANQGGGVYSEIPIIIMDSTFSENYAESMGGGFNGSAQLIFNSTFIRNRCDLAGGGLFSQMTTLVACAITGNDAYHHGGGISCWDNSIIINCMIDGNTAALGNGSGGGGGIHITDHSTPVIRNCTITGNSAERGGSIFCEYSSLSMTNSIIWNNTPEAYFSIDSDPVIQYSCIEEGFEGEGNINANPLFVSGSMGNFYLSHTSAGQNQDSPCVNAGNLLSSDVCFDCSGTEICLDDFWTSTTGTHDSGQVDMGAHYPIPLKLPAKVDVSMPAAVYYPSDKCWCKTIVTNYGFRSIVGFPLIVILDIFGNYFFAPGFEGFDFVDASFPVGQTEVIVLPEFLWPSGLGSIDGIRWFGMLTNLEMTDLASEVGIFEFGWSE